MHAVRPGDPILASLWNELVGLLQKQQLSVAPPLELRQTAGGTHLSLATLGIRLVELTSSLSPGSSATAKWKRFTPALVSDADDSTMTVHDPLGDKAGSIGDRALVAFLDGLWVVVQLKC